ncbi:SLC13 family permease [Sulfobacillus harzensis]|uniref:TRAP transporter large permease subunit n=1 Tax=Sulfobacillus harzensis TaxID=2729629 RepID=A0A7Y0Q1N4_9FIRM|nr:SLC13 family permease [Sulfobacillus harzensis]NMP21016.1 TRAP transporter large permease subunit [Sulfobacillus harzensis]
MSGPQWVALIAIVVLYVLLLGDWFHRAWVALGLALALVLSQTVSPATAFHSIDWNTIFLLAGMMIFVAYLGDAGLFVLLGRWAKSYARGKPWRLLGVFYVITAVVSAFLDNVTTILLLSPILIQAAEEMGVDPVPLLMVEVVASNIGGMGTLIGDPPNILIGTAANLSFTEFTTFLGPAAVGILVLLALLLPRYVKMAPAAPIQSRDDADDARPIARRRLLALLGVLVLMLAGFVLQRQLGVPVGYIALFGALVATVIAGSLGRHWWRRVDYGTLGFFIGVFVLVGALESSGLIHYVAGWLLIPGLGPWLPFLLFLGSAIFSALLDNVPLVAALIPVLAHMVAQDPHFGVELWVAVAMGAALGGNATVIGASANVVAQGLALERGYPLSFARYARFGLKTAGFTALLGLAYLAIRF